MFQSGICKERKFERRHFYVESELIKKIVERAQKENTTMSKLVCKLLKKELSCSEMRGEDDYSQTIQRRTKRS